MEEQIFSCVPRVVYESIYLVKVAIRRELGRGVPGSKKESLF